MLLGIRNRRGHGRKATICDRYWLRVCLGARSATARARSRPDIDYSFLSVPLSKVMVWAGDAASVHNRFMTMR